MLLAPWRSALLLALQKLINRFAISQKTGTSSRAAILSNFSSVQAESYSGELLFTFHSV